MFFSNLTRHEVTKEHPELRVGAVAKILGMFCVFTNELSIFSFESFLTAASVCCISLFKKTESANWNRVNY